MKNTLKSGLKETSRPQAHLQTWTWVEAIPEEEQRDSFQVTQQNYGNLSAAWAGDWEEGQEAKRGGPGIVAQHL